jgi:hypothetical protein
MKNPSQISEYIARACKPTLFRVPNGETFHVALLAFPQTSQTLCGLTLVELERVIAQPPPHLLCARCTYKLGLLAANLITE